MAWARSPSTDHNEISGALEGRAKADGFKVIVGEEVKTAGQGEVIGLFLEEKIPRGMTLDETIAEIKRQGGLVYVPHPFDRMHSVPDYEHLLSVIDEVDAIEVFNPRIAIAEFNEEAVRFAAKYRIPAGAGSDAHVTQGLGSVRIRMRTSTGRKSSCSRCARPTSSATRPASCTSRRSNSCRRRRCPKGPDGPRASAAYAAPPAASPDAVARTSTPAVQSDSGARYRRRDPGEIPRAGDPRAEHVRAPAERMLALPPRAAHARARLGPPPGRHLHGQALGPAGGGRGGSCVLRAHRQTP